MNALIDAQRLAQQLAPTALTPHAISCSGGLTVTVLPYGGRVQSIKLHGQELTLSQADPAFYLTDSAALGASVGRYANRIANAAYQDSKGVNWPLSASQPPHCLHGGAQGFAQRVWTVVEHSADSLLLELISPNGDQGFPGTLRVQQRLQVVDSIDSQGRPGGELQLSFTASTDAETVVNLTNHCYFNLAPQQTVEALAAHQLELMADQYLAVDECGIPLPDAVRSVNEHEFDFRAPKAVGPLCRQNADLPHGLDHCFVNRFVVRTTKNPLPLQARLSYGSGAAQRTLELRSSQPGLQVYVSTYLSKPFASFQGICLEAQNFPDAPNRADFPSAVLRPGELYQQQICYRFS
ncbi:aldose epimerase family protein [Rheinheimera texasensis]|uniref:aldose epimerase family protein n=1 Tax=Rheinheimera texasensis TaxID=306205 RepID=UPI0032B24AFD